MTVEEYYNKTKAASLKDDSDNPANKWHEWRDLSADEKAGWERKLAEESATKKATDVTPPKK